MKYLVFTLTFSFLLTACGKDDKEPTKTEILTSGSWKFDNGGIDQDKNGTVDISFTSGILPACALDNSATFNSDYTGINDEGLLKCGTAQTTPFNWSFASNETAINISGTGVLGISGQFKILELNATRFGLSKDTTISGFNMSAIVNLKH
jgi:hypothetical protein